MQFIATVAFDEWAGDGKQTKREFAATFDESATLKEMAAQIGDKVRDAVDDTVIVKLFPNKASWSDVQVGMENPQIIFPTENPLIIHPPEVR